MCLSYVQLMDETEARMGDLISNFNGPFITFHHVDFVQSGEFSNMIRAASNQYFQSMTSPGEGGLKIDSIFDCHASNFQLELRWMSHQF